MAKDRRSFLKKAGGLTAVMAAGPIGLSNSGGGWTSAEPVAAANAGDARGFLTATLALVLEGADQGYVVSAEGGGAVAEVISEAAIPGEFAKKHLGDVHYEQLKLEAGINMGQTLYDWMAQSMTPGEGARKDGAILAADFDYNVVQERTFTNALLTQVGFPALDATSAAPAFFSLTLDPESTALLAGSGNISGNVGPRPRQWLASNFRIALGPLPTSRVVKIDAFVVKQQATKDSTDGLRQHSKQPARVEIPNLRVTFSAADMAAWNDFFDEFVLNGTNGQAEELSGKIEYLSADLGEVLGTVALKQVGIFALAPQPPESAGGVAMVTADLYVEEMTFVRGSAGPG